MINFTEKASGKIKELMEKENLDPSTNFLRISVRAGGCSGLKYNLYFDNIEMEGDQTSEIIDELKVKIDKMSQPYLDGINVDFMDSLNGQGFKIENPNAHGSCACGDSFN